MLISAVCVLISSAGIGKSPVYSSDECSLNLCTDNATVLAPASEHSGLL